MTQLEALFMIVGHRIGGGGSPSHYRFQKVFRFRFLNLHFIRLKIKRRNDIRITWITTWTTKTADNTTYDLLISAAFYVAHSIPPKYSL